MRVTDNWRQNRKSTVGPLDKNDREIHSQNGGESVVCTEKKAKMREKTV
jgi:hypothetical protein